MPRSAREMVHVARPYPPGWLDRLTDWIDQLPGPNALYYLGLALLQFGYLTTLLWLNGKLPVGSLEWQRTFVVVVAPYFLWVRSHLDQVARAALHTFRPALPVGDAEFARLGYELTTLPARTTRIVTTVAVAAALLNFALLPDSIVSQYAPSIQAAVLEIGPIAVFTLAVTAVSAFQAIHQLRMVARIHDLAGKLDLFQSKPLHAFSGLTARTGASFLVLTYYVVTVRPDLVSESRTLDTLLIIMVPTAVACFVLPLRDMHRRLAGEKDRALAQVTSRLQALFARLHERIDQGVVADADKLNLQITGLITERDALARISTWPWQPASLTVFASAILPALLWVIQRALERVGF